MMSSEKAKYCIGDIAYIDGIPHICIGGEPPKFKPLVYTVESLANIIPKTCTCGAEKCGSSIHSDWCDLKEEYNG